jgi:hypothetical protein
MTEMKKLIRLHPSNNTVVEILTVPESYVETMLLHEHIHAYVPDAELGWVYSDGLITPSAVDYDAMIAGKCRMVDNARLVQQARGLSWIFDGVNDIIQLRDDADKGNIDRLVNSAVAEIVLAGGVPGVTKTFTVFAKSNTAYTVTAVEMVAIGSKMQEHFEALVRTAHVYKDKIRRTSRPVDRDALFDLPDWPE